MNKNRWIKVTGVLLSLCLLFSMMSVMAGATNTLLGVEFTYVHYPVVGSEPVYDLPVAGSEDYAANNVIWYSNETGNEMQPGEVFEEGISYRIEIYIEAQGDNAFNSDDMYGNPYLFAITFNGVDVAEDTSVRYTYPDEDNKTEIYLQYDFPALEIHSVDAVAIDEVEVPVPGAKPDYDVVAGGTGYELHEVGAEWFYKYAEDDYRYVPDDEDFVFEEGEEYMVKIWLARTDDYIFDLDNITATVNGETAEVNPASVETVIAVDYYFGECTAPVEEDTTAPAEEDTTAAQEETTAKAEETPAAPVKPVETTAAPTAAAPTTTAKPAETTTAKTEEKPKVKKPAKVKIKKPVSKKKKQIVVTWNKVKTANGYQVAYSTSKKFTKKATKTKLIKKAKTVKTTIKKLKSGKKYFIKVRAYKTVDGKKLYGNYSKVKNVKVK